MFYTYKLFKQLQREFVKIKGNHDDRDTLNTLLNSPKFKLSEISDQKLIATRNLDELFERLEKFSEFFKLPFPSTIFEFDMRLATYEPIETIVAVKQIDYNRLRLYLKSYLAKVKTRRNDQATIDQCEQYLNHYDEHRASEYFEFLCWTRHPEGHLMPFTIVTTPIKSATNPEYIRIIQHEHYECLNSNHINNIVQIRDNHWDQSSESIILYFDTMFLVIYEHILSNLLWINCKNNRIHEYLPSKSNFKKEESKNIISKFKYKIIDLYKRYDSITTDQDVENCSKLPRDVSCHHVRGHFKNIKGQLYWWSAHIRNKDKELKRIKQEYQTHD